MTMDAKLKIDLKKLQAKAMELGASATKVVKVPKIKTGAWTRMKCQFARRCGIR